MKKTKTKLATVVYSGRCEPCDSKIKVKLRNCRLPQNSPLTITLPTCPNCTEPRVLLTRVEKKW